MTDDEVIQYLKQAEIDNKVARERQEREEMERLEREMLSTDKASLSGPLQKLVTHGPILAARNKISSVIVEDAWEKVTQGSSFEEGWIFPTGYVPFEVRIHLQGAMKSPEAACKNLGNAVLKYCLLANSPDERVPTQEDVKSAMRRF